MYLSSFGEVEQLADFVRIAFVDESQMTEI